VTPVPVRLRPLQTPFLSGVLAYPNYATFSGKSGLQPYVSPFIRRVQGEWSITMRGATWQDYGTPGTQALEHEEIEQAITRLTRVWDDAQAHVQDDGGLSAQDCCDGCYQQAS
jgi:hypothetical protein